MKNTKIMAVLAIFLAAALFIGAASAVDATVEVKGLQSSYDHNDTITLTITSNTTISNLSINVTYGDGDAFHPAAFVNNVSTTTFRASYGNETISFAKNTSSADNIVNLPMTRSITVNNRPVDDGKDAFVFEHIYVAGTNGKLTKYSDGQNPTAVNIISGTAATDGIGTVFYLTEDAVDGQYGAYYYTGSPGNAGKFIYIWYPEISLQAELADSPGDSIDGTTITRETQVSFLINSPKVAPAMDAVAKIVFTTPSGGTTTAFGGVDDNDCSDIKLEDGTQTAVRDMSVGPNAEAGLWTAQAEYVTSPFNPYAAKSNTIKFTVQSSTLTLTAAKDSIIRSNSFTVTIQGEAKTPYVIYLDNAEASDNAPTLTPDQSGYKGPVTSIKSPQSTAATTVYGGAVFETNAAGQRVVQYDTTGDTKDKSYTVKVNALKETFTNNGLAVIDPSTYDTVKVKVEIGAVTMSASGDGSYYIGDEIVLSGTNTDSDYVFLFVSGQNVDAVVLKDLPTKTVASAADNPVNVNTDDTWEYKWDTAGIALDPGTYTIYATSKLTNGKSTTATSTNSKYGTMVDGVNTAVKLSDSEYATVSVRLMKPFLSAVPSGTVVAKGDKLVITGTAEGDPSTLNLYIFGTNYFVDDTITVEDDGTYEKEVTIDSGLASGQYFVVIQHPMMNGAFDAALNKTYGKDNWFFEILNVGPGGNAQSSFYVTGNDKLTGSQAADSLTKMIDSANIDDIYTKLTFTVSDPWIAIDGPGDQAMGTTFTISGTTNLAVDDQISVEVTSSSFNAAEKTQNTGTSGVTVMTKVVAGDGVNNVWSVEVDSTNWELDEYIVNVNGLEIDVTATATFNLVEKTVTPTATATGATPTTTATATATTAPTQTPGFGAFVALAGLGAVALLVLRRN